LRFVGLADSTVYEGETAIPFFQERKRDPLNKHYVDFASTLARKIAAITLTLFRSTPAIARGRLLIPRPGSDTLGVRFAAPSSTYAPDSDWVTVRLLGMQFDPSL
jgi:hypothetical protein